MTGGVCLIDGLLTGALGEGSLLGAEDAGGRTGDAAVGG